MGEYAMYQGQSIKIGTCESMYYLRADQARKVTPESGSLDPVAQRGHIRFRFPFPGEDGIEPGAFENYDRGIALRGVKAPEGIDHYRVQFTNQSIGYVVSLPCPESIQGAPDGLGPVTVAEGVKVGRNGFAGATFLTAQRYIDGELWPVLRCACGGMWRVPFEELGPIIDSLREQHESDLRRHVNAGLPAETASLFYLELARRVGQGFDREYVAGLFA